MRLCVGASGTIISTKSARKHDTPTKNVADNRNGIVVITDVYGDLVLVIYIHDTHLKPCHARLSYLKKFDQNKASME